MSDNRVSSERSRARSTTDALARGVPGGGGSSKARKGDDVPREAATEDQQQVVFGIFVAMMIGLTVFQKIGYAPSKSVVIPVVMPLAFACLGIGMLFARPVFRPERTILYLAVIVVSTLSNVLFSRGFSVTSMGLYFVLYLPFLLAFETTRETYHRCLRFFSSLMLVFAAVVWIQQAVQFSIGYEYWPNLDKLLPKEYLIPEFNYVQPFEWALHLMKPNAVVFLEVAILSQFLTLALIVELLILQRARRAIFFGATLFATFAGTGLFLLAVSLPIVLTRMNTRTFAILLATAFVALFVALQLHWFDIVAHRFGEFQETGSSANSRFIAPLDRIRTALLDDSAVYSGVGAGRIESGGNTFWWPIVKTTVEYGLIEGVLFYGFYLFSMLDRTPNRQFAFVLAIWFSFEGTLLTHLYPIGCVALSSMFLIRESRRSRQRSDPRGEPRLGTSRPVPTAT